MLLTTEAYEFLKHYQKELKENGSYHTLLQRKTEEYDQENKAGLTTPEQKNFQLKLLELLSHGPRTPPSHQKKPSSSPKLVSINNASFAQTQ